MSNDCNESGELGAGRAGRVIGGEFPLRPTMTEVMILEITTVVIDESPMVPSPNPDVRLTSGELELLSVLWRHGPATIAEAHQALGQPIGYTTVQTRLNRLTAKGVVDKSGARPARYRARLAPEDVSRHDLDTLVRHVNQGRVVPLVAHLMRDRQLSREEITELRRLIDEAERQSKHKSEPARGDC